MIHGSSTRRSYSDLLSRGKPRTITNENDAEAIQVQIDALIDKGDLTEAESDYLSLLGDLVWAWEQGRYQRSSLSPRELIKALMEDGGYRQKDLVPEVFPTPSIASAVLRGKRPLTYEYVRKLATFFHVSPALFFEDSAGDSSASLSANDFSTVNVTMLEDRVAEPVIMVAAPNAGKFEAHLARLYEDPHLLIVTSESFQLPDVDSILEFCRLALTLKVDDQLPEPREYFEDHLHQFVRMALVTGIGRDVVMRVLRSIVDQVAGTADIPISARSREQKIALIASGSD